MTSHSVGCTLVIWASWHWVSYFRNSAYSLLFLSQKCSAVFWEVAFFTFHTSCTLCVTVMLSDIYVLDFGAFSCVTFFKSRTITKINTLRQPVHRTHQTGLCVFEVWSYDKQVTVQVQVYTLISSSLAMKIPDQSKNADICSIPRGPRPIL